MGNVNDMPGALNPKKYPYKEVLAKSKFYLDEAYFDAEKEGDMDLASGCDMCLKPAEFMTFSSEKAEPPDGEAYYICAECVRKYGLKDMLEDPAWLEGKSEIRSLE